MGPRAELNPPDKLRNGELTPSRKQIRHTAKLKTWHQHVNTKQNPPN